MNIRTTTVIVMLTTMFISHLEAKEKPLKVVICAGQSNMYGWRSRIEHLPDPLKGEQKNLFFKPEEKQWVPLAPHVIASTQKQGFGPEVSFAHELSVLLKENVGIIKCCRGGTTLAKNWKPGEGDFYKKMLSMVNDAQQSRDIEIIGLIWMQGESDGGNKGFASAYKKNLEAFIKTLRKEVNRPKMIFVAGRINSPESKFKFTELVRKAQEECEAPLYKYIDCDSLPKVKDNLHYTTMGLVEMGKNFAEAMMAIKNKERGRLNQ